MKRTSNLVIEKEVENTVLEAEREPERVEKFLKEEEKKAER